ncbi:MAG TPA: hypothetical protein VFB74_28210 [Kribbellaceae bacterium]|nr:hypothetical protein [Kribbellaceae bacterium]
MSALRSRGLVCGQTRADPAPLRRVPGGSRSAQDVVVRVDIPIDDDPEALTTTAAAVRTMHAEGVLVEYDFDLYHPVARFSTVQGNVRILRSIVCDGTLPAVFSLLSEPGRSCSPWFEKYHRRLTVAVRPWLRERGFSVRLHDAWLELTLAERMVRQPPSVAAHKIALQRATMRSNTILLDLVAESARDFDRHGESGLLDRELIGQRTSALQRQIDALAGRVPPVVMPDDELRPKSLCLEELK